MKVQWELGRGLEPGIYYYTFGLEGGKGGLFGEWVALSYDTTSLGRM